MRVVVVGTTGNVGTSLLNAFAGEDRVSSVLGISRRPATDASRYPKTNFVAADVATSERAHHFRGA